MSFPQNTWLARVYLRFKTQHLAYISEEYTREYVLSQTLCVYVSVVAQLDNLISSDRPTAAVSSTDCVTVHTEWTIPSDPKKTQNKRYWGNWMKPFVPQVQTGRLDEGSGGRGRSYRSSGIFPGWEEIICINICKYAPASMFALNSLSKWVKDSLDSFE